MRIAQIVPSLEDRHGGPSKSVRALADALTRAGDEVELLATAENPSPVSGGAATVRIFPRIAPQFICRSPGLAAHLATQRYECIHSHSLWLLTVRYAHAAARRTGAPLVISPRGMMSGWAWEHRRWRKKLAELLIHPGSFRAADGWHATSPEEGDDIRRLGFSQPVCVAPNGVELPSAADLAAAREHWLTALPVLRDRPVALFYSRFHRKKRLRELLELWLSEPRGDWLLALAGLPEEYTVAEVSGWIVAAGAQDKVLVADGTGRPPPYAAASLFLLPSHTENFGLVIAEALAAGVPALVTDATPWRGLAQADAGWCVPWGEYGPALARALNEPPADLAARGARGRIWMERDFSWSRTAALLQTFYHTLRHG